MHTLHGIGIHFGALEGRSPVEKSLAEFIFPTFVLGLCYRAQSLRWWRPYSRMNHMSLVHNSFNFAWEFVTPRKCFMSSSSSNIWWLKSRGPVGFVSSLHKTSARPCLIIESKFAWKEAMVTNNLIFFRHIGASLHLAKNNIVLVWRCQFFFLMCQTRKKNKLLRRHLDKSKSMFPFPKKGKETEGSKRQPSLA